MWLLRLSEVHLLTTPLVHPKKQLGRRRFYAYSYSIEGVNEAGRTTVVASGNCAYQEYPTPGEGQFDAGAVTQDRVLIPAWLPNLSPRMILVLTLASAPSFRRRFDVSDVIPTGTPPYETCLVVTPI